MNAPRSTMRVAVGIIPLMLGPIFIFVLLVGDTIALQADDATEHAFRPFRTIVNSVRTASSEKQYEYFVRLSKGLMAQDYAIFTKQHNLPHFGHLVDELYEQRMLPLLRIMMRKAEIEPVHYCVIAEKLSRGHDPETFEILTMHTERAMTNVVESSGEDIDAYSALSLGNYLTHQTYHEKAQHQLVRVIQHHGHPSVRAFAAQALGNSRSPEAAKVLEAATQDKGRVHTSQGPYDTVAEYAQEALQKIRDQHSITSGTSESSKK